MGYGKKRPIFVPENLFAELDKLSKSALMDIAWNFATQISGQEGDSGLIMGAFRTERDLVLSVRKVS